jgi:hypothetical protein
VQVRCDEGVAIHIGPKPCVCAREGAGEASAGERIGQPLSRESHVIPGADVLIPTEGDMAERDNASVPTARRGRSPGMCGSSLFGNREISRPSGALASPDRVGKVRSRSRR